MFWKRRKLTIREAKRIYYRNKLFALLEQSIPYDFRYIPDLWVHFMEYGWANRN